MLHVCQLLSGECNGGAAHSTTGSEPSYTTCRPCWTAPAAGAGGDGAGASASEEDVGSSARAYSSVRAC
jgi:hypothetical protein